MSPSSIPKTGQKVNKVVYLVLSMSKDECAESANSRTSVNLCSRHGYMNKF